MKRIVLVLAAATAALAAFGAVARAGIVFPYPNSTISATRINLVGRDPGAPGDQADSTAAFAKVTVTVRDVANNPVPNVSVVLDYSGCTSDLKFSSTTSYHHTLLRDCRLYEVEGYTDASGTVQFVVIGARGGDTPHLPGCMIVFADSYLIGRLGVGAYDQNGVNGLTLADLGLWAADYFAATNPDRSDYNGDGVVTLADLSMWAGAYFANHSPASAASYCP